jgi:GNAT superfamily N-acetyltransferase
MTQGTGTAITEATSADLAEVTAILAAAFDAGRVADWLICDRAERTPIYCEYFAMIAQHALSGAAQVEMIPGAAVALWYPARNGDPHLVPDDYPVRLADITGKHMSRFLAMDDVMHVAHLRQPHWYLGFLAVMPEHQNLGQGSRLLEYRHRELDRRGERAFLIASSKESARLYERHGYGYPTPPVRLPNGPAMFPMGRPPLRIATT